MSAASGEPEVIHDVRETFKTGRTYLYTQVGDMVCAIADLLAAYETLAQQRDAAVRDAEARERELHDEAVMLHTALIGRACAEPGSVSACHPMICDCGTPYEDYTHRDLCEAVARLRARLEACERVVEEFVDAEAAFAEETRKNNPYIVTDTWQQSARRIDAARKALKDYRADLDTPTDDFGPNDGHARTVRRTPPQDAATTRGEG